MGINHTEFHESDAKCIMQALSEIKTKLEILDEEFKTL